MTCLFLPTTFRRKTGASALRCIGVALALGLVTSAYTVAQSVYTRDCGPDNSGAEPSLSSAGGPCGTVYGSPTLKVQPSSPFSGSVPHGAVAGQTNYVYVTLVNTGSQVASGDVSAYWAKLAGNQIWPSGWNSHYDNNTPPRLIGDFIGSVNVNICPGCTAQVEIPWNGVPNPADFGQTSVHFCVVAMYDSPADPLPSPMVANMVTNTSNSNNICWRNTDATTPPKPDIYMIVGNPFGQQETFDLHFDETAAAGGSFLNHGTMVVDLGTNLYNIWVNGGSIGQNVAPHSAASGNTKVDILSSAATLENLTFTAQEEYTINVFFSKTAGADDPTATFDWDISQHHNGSLFGGAIITADWTSGGEGKLALPVDAASEAEYNLTARPNPTQGSTTISYSLPEESRVSLTIYDATGNPVRTIVEPTVQNKGGYEVEWDGLTASGAQAPSGQYFYRLETGRRNIERQITLTR